MKVTQSCPTLGGLYSPWNSPGQHTGVGSLSLLQGIFPTQGSNPGLPHCCWVLYQLRHKGSPFLLLFLLFLLLFKNKRVSCYMQSKLSAYNRLLHLQDVLCKPHDNKANTKTYNRFTKDKEKTIKAYYCRKS